ncbi:TetR family transcriptional regulator [Massilia sp.]|uniref:TetR/AcrR family transcriptional regulator n=1 Tax=Massilia sp. TaxID=1882437 RepID=UPI0028AC0E72|nr:TetR family transcriptional regulator [Massilia sp.]
MNKPRGRPARGKGITREQVLDAALRLLEAGGAGFSMRALAARLEVTPMSLYHHVGDHAALLRAIADRVYAGVLAAGEDADDPLAGIRELLLRYHGLVADYPQLTLAIFAEPAAFAGTTRAITDRLRSLLERLTVDPLLWLETLVDHAHGNALAFQAARGDRALAGTMRERYRQALDRLLESLPESTPRAASPRYLV